MSSLQRSFGAVQPCVIYSGGRSVGRDWREVVAEERRALRLPCSVGYNGTGAWPVHMRIDEKPDISAWCYALKSPNSPHRSYACISLPCHTARGDSELDTVVMPAILPAYLWRSVTLVNENSSDRSGTFSRSYLSSRVSFMVHIPSCRTTLYSHCLTLSSELIFAASSIR